jgi:thioredoxin reductase (NADPH)
MEEVLELIAKSEDAVYEVKTKERTHQTKSIIIATGAQPKRLGVEGEERLIGRGVSYCGTCDGPLFRDKEIVVIGAGDRAVEEAIFLSGYAKKVTLVHRRNELRASGILQEKAQKNPKINFVLESVVEEIIGQNRVEGLKIKNAKTESLNTIACQGVFIFVGIKPNTDFIKNQLHLDESGYIITDQNLKTSRESIFASGDCRKKSLYQVISACSEGATAADSAQKYLLKL